MKRRPCARCKKSRYARSRPTGPTTHCLPCRRKLALPDPSRLKAAARPHRVKKARAVLPKKDEEKSKK